MIFILIFRIYDIKKIIVNIEAISDYRAWVDNVECILLNIFGYKLGGFRGSLLNKAIGGVNERHGVHSIKFVENRILPKFTNVVFDFNTIQMLQ